MELDVTPAQCAGRSYVSIGQSKTKSVGSPWLPVINHGGVKFNLAKLVRVRGATKIAPQ
jgi:hypothetical protein